MGHNGPTGPPDLTSSTPAVPDPNAPAPSDRLWLRSELMGTQVITRDTGRRLGVVGEVVVDIDRREVVALGLRDNPLTRFLPGLPRWMPLERIRQVGDVILVDSADSLQEGFDPDRYSKVINCQVISEAGAMLGRVLGFSTSSAHVWGQLKAKWDAAGLVIPTLDSQIAAVAQRHGLTVITRNTRDFVKTGVKVLNPFH